jgi:hypothetical protein
MGWNFAEQSGNVNADGGIVNEDLLRCDREIAEIWARPDVVAGTCRAYLPAIGINDWTVERDLIEQERLQLQSVQLP